MMKLRLMKLRLMKLRLMKLLLISPECPSFPFSQALIDLNIESNRVHSLPFSHALIATSKVIVH
jgi:hypothetical protein